MHKMKEVCRKMGAVLLSGVMALSLLMGIPFNEMNKVEAASLNNPSKDGNGVVTWDCVYFGKYPQSDKTGVTKDPIKWRVLSVDGDDAFLLADRNLDAWQYYTKFANITWEMCTMRSWLNGYGPTSNSASISYKYDNFIDQAFSTEEQNAIMTTTVTPDTDNGGNETQDKIYLLSYNDALNPDYGFSSETTADKSRERVNTAYVAAGGSAADLYDVKTNAVNETNWWWLRTPGTFTNNACYVGLTGSVSNNGYVDTGRYAVCPALHLDLTQTSLWTYAGTVSSDGTCNEIAYPTKTLSSIKADKVKTAYEVGDILNVDDVTVTAVYSTGEELPVEDFEVDVTGIDMTTEGTKEILISYTEGDVTKTITVEIEVIQPEVTDSEEPEEPEEPEDDDSGEVYDVSLVRIKAEKEKVTYEEGEELILDDLKVTAVYSDGDEVVVTEYKTNASEIDMTKAGVKELIVTYKEADVEKTAIVSIEVVEPYEEKNDDVEKDNTVYISKLEITGISKKIAAGKKVKLTVKVTPSDADNQELIWSSSNKQYATVNQKGQVTLKSKGIGKNVTITAKTTDGSGVKATYTIRIMKHAVKKLTIKGEKVQTVKAGRSVKLKTTIKTTGKSVNKKLKWTSSNTRYATVSQKGKVKTKKAGKGKTVKITAMTTDGSNKKATVKIKIK